MTEWTTCTEVEPAFIPKNQRDRLRFSIDQRGDHRVLCARVWYLPGDGEGLRPGRDGWAIALDRLPAILIALQKIEAQARAAGLLEEEEQRP